MIEWDCNITYPTTDKILSHLSHLGTFSGILDHEELFPPGTKAKEAELEFQLTLKVDRQLLRGEFSYVRDGQLIPLKDVRYTPLPLRPWSEYANEKLSSDYYLEGPAGSEGPQSISEQKGPAPTTISVSPSSTGSPDLPVANQSSFSAGTVYSDPIPTGSVDIAASVDFVADLLRRQHENQSSRPYYVRKATRTSPPRRSPRAISVVSKSVSDLQGPNLDW